MKDITTIGIDIAKNYIQIHGADSKGKGVLKKCVTRDRFLVFMANLPRCLVGMEACGGAHYWANELIKLGFDRLKKLAKEDEYCARISTLPGIGPLTATALIAKIGNGSEFKKGRELSAYLGLVPKQHSSGEKRMLLGISKHGDRYIRQLLIHGGRAVVQATMRKSKNTGLFEKQDKHYQWIRKLIERAGVNKASVAIANKNARMVIALLKNGTEFQASLAH